MQLLKVRLDIFLYVMYHQVDSVLWQAQQGLKYLKGDFTTATPPVSYRGQAWI